MMDDALVENKQKTQNRNSLKKKAMEIKVCGEELVSVDEIEKTKIDYDSDESNFNSIFSCDSKDKVRDDIVKSVATKRAKP